MKNLYLFKKCYICFYFIIFLPIYSNILLQRPPSLSACEIQALVENWQTQFKWCFGPGCNFTCYYEKGTSSFILKIFGLPIRSCNYHYINELIKYIQNSDMNDSAYYLEKPLQYDTPNPKKIDFDSLLKLIHNKKIVFYTGAGISAGKVETMADLRKKFNLDQGIRFFLSKLLLQPTYLTTAFFEFCQSAMYQQPTAAHYALHEIVIKKNCAIITENIDLLQHRTGSLPLFTHSDTIHALRAEDFQEIDILLCVGLSHDDCGFIARYKKYNPSGILIAVDVGIPNYLSNNDYIVQEDIQTILPQWAKKHE